MFCGGYGFEDGLGGGGGGIDWGVGSVGGYWEWIVMKYIKIDKRKMRNWISLYCFINIFEMYLFICLCVLLLS